MMISSSEEKSLPQKLSEDIIAFILKENLQPGDILIRTGADAHVVMFLGWTDDGRIRCVHETSGSINNVTVGTRNAGWPYYRRLID